MRFFLRLRHKFKQIQDTHIEPIQDTRITFSRSLSFLKDFQSANLKKNMQKEMYNEEK